MRFASPNLLSALESRATVIVPSQLIASVVANEFGREQLRKGLESWPRPHVHSIGAWLKRCWENARYAQPNTPALLSAAQEQVLWQRVIRDRAGELFSIETTASLAARAARLVAEWHIPLDNDAWNEHADGQEFRRWLEAFQDKCTQQNWIPNSGLWNLVPDWIRAGVCQEENVVFAAFRKVTPALARLAEALGTAAQFVRVQPNRQPRSTAVRPCDAFPEEIEFAARGARYAFEQNREASIGVFVPDLKSHGALVQRVFQQVFYPARSLRVDAESVFHIHHSPTLLDEPMIVAAMLIVGLGRPRMPTSDAGAIIRSSWICSASAERDLRARAEFQLRRSRELDVSIRNIQSSARNCPQFAAAIRQLGDNIRDKPVRAELAFWSEFFSDLTACLGWPGDAELTARERDVLDAWKDALTKLASLSPVTGRLTFDEAVARLRALLDEPAPAVGDLLSPIQVLDVSDADGLRFDSVFVAGLSEDSNLFRRVTSPLIPLKLQRACGVPGANPTTAHAYRQELLSDLLGSAPHLQVSYAKRLLPGAGTLLEADADRWPIWEGRTPQQSFVPAELDKIADVKAPPYRDLGRSLGGTGLIKDQSQCPFRAFAARRLNARGPEHGSFGLDALERGAFVHDALKNVWDELKTQRALRDYELLLPSLVADAVTRAVQTRKDGPLHEQLSIAEIDRLTDVILDWLRVECERRQPFEVEITEEERQLNIAGLQLQIRMDRLDRLRNGKRLLIDYKSGETNAANLNGDRPREPQLLAYAAAMRDEVDGIFFAQLKPREPKLLGFARERHIEGQKPVPENLSWDEYLDDRIEVVERLAAEFIAGEAAVDPIKKACEYCQLASFCRIHELRCANEGEAVAD
jgi:probable DNA repair protein